MSLDRPATRRLAHAVVLFNALWLVIIVALALHDILESTVSTEPRSAAGVRFLGRLAVWYLRSLALVATLRSLFCCFRSIQRFGATGVLHVNQMWALKERTPYAFHSPASTLKRRKHRTVTIGYILSAAACFYGAVLTTSPVLEALGLMFAAFVLQQLFIHGQVPAVLVLGESSPAAIATLIKVQIVLGSSGVASLLDVWRSAPIPVMVAAAARPFRTTNEQDHEWWDTFVTLARFALVIIVDGRNPNVLVARELEWILDRDLEPKLICITSDDGQAPLLTALPWWSAADLRHSVIMLTEVQAIAEAARRLRTRIDIDALRKAA